MLFVGFYDFPSSRWLFELFVGFWSSSCASWVLDSNFKLSIFCYQWTHQGGDWETKWSVSWFECDESLTWQCLNSNLGHFCGFTFIFVSFRESCLLVLCCAYGKCAMAASDEDRGRSRRPVVEDRGWSHTRWSDDQEDGWHCMQSAPCTWRQGARVSIFGLKSKVDGLYWFLLQTIGMVSQWFDSKTTMTVFSSLA
jgi:hypothetical protein